MSKMASHRLHTNNPNVADLNDDNRPSKIAEKFSELYDNQWTEAFEELSRIMSEIDTIYMLLRIVRVSTSSRGSNNRVMYISNHRGIHIQIRVDPFGNVQGMFRTVFHNRVTYMRVLVGDLFFIILYFVIFTVCL